MRIAWRWALSVSWPISLSNIQLCNCIGQSFSDWWINELDVGVKPLFPRLLAEKFPCPWRYVWTLMFRVQFLANSYMILPKGKAKLGSCTLIYTVVMMRTNNSNFRAFISLVENRWMSHELWTYAFGWNWPVFDHADQWIRASDLRKLNANFVARPNLYGS